MSEIVKIKDLPFGVSGIYKINYPNGKVSIGQSNDIRRRAYEHKTGSKRVHAQLCDLKIQEFGMELDEIEILERVNIADLDIMEEKWANIYDAQNPEKGYNIARCGQYGKSKSVFTDEQILDIRKRRYQGERKKDVYNSTYTNFSFATFERIWLGRSCSHIGTEYLIPVGAKSRQEYSSQANSGENNGRAKVTEQDVRKIRELFDNGATVAEIAKIYTQIKKVSIRRICNRETWKNVI